MIHAVTTLREEKRRLWEALEGVQAAIDETPQNSTSIGLMTEMRGMETALIREIVQTSAAIGLICRMSQITQLEPDRTIPKRKA